MVTSDATRGHVIATGTGSGTRVRFTPGASAVFPFFPMRQKTPIACWLACSGKLKAASDASSVTQTSGHILLPVHPCFRSPSSEIFKAGLP